MVRAVTTWQHHAWIVLVAATAACSFSVEPGASSPGDGGVGDARPDSSAPDAGACTAASLACVTGDVLRTCSGPGATPVDTPCAWGCVASSASHCGAFIPAGGVVSAADLGGLTDLVIGQPTVIDSSSMTIGGAAWGDSRTVDASAPGVGVFRFANLTIEGSVQLTGTRAIALVASGDILIDAIVDGRPTLCTDGSAGPGGLPGGQVGTAAAGPGGGAGGATAGEGGGGGGHGADGGAGGPLLIGPAGGAAWGDPLIPQLVGGGGGGGGGDGGGATGGGGGAGIQLVAGGKIHVRASGGVNAGGCGGTRGGNADSGGGGGAGGTILLEAKQVIIDGRLAVNGGGGGAGAGGSSGTAGRLDRTPAAGGTDDSVANAGAGGAGDALAGGAGIASLLSFKSGGGGGAVGRIRITTKSGTATISSSGMLSPALTDSPTTATQGRVHLQ